MDRGRLDPPSLTAGILDVVRLPGNAQDRTFTNLVANVHLNVERNADLGTRVIARQVDWEEPSTYPEGSFDVVVGSDILYREHQAKLIAHMFDVLCRPGGSSSSSSSSSGSSSSSSSGGSAGSSSVSAAVADSVLRDGTAGRTSHALFVAPECRQGIALLVSELAAVGFHLVDSRGCPPSWTDPAAYGLSELQTGERRLP